MHFAITASSSSSSSYQAPSASAAPIGYEFEFSARFGSSASAAPGSMSSADELFLNGQIRPMKLSTHLQRPQVLAPLLDLDEDEQEEEEGVSVNVVRGRDLRLRDKSLRRRTRSMSPLRTNTPFDWSQHHHHHHHQPLHNQINKAQEKPEDPSASSSRSSSAGRSSKRWVFLKDFLRSKSEGRSNNKFWSTISFSPIKDKKSTKPTHHNNNNNNNNSDNKNGPPSKRMSGKPTNGVGKRRVPPSPHELHYKANRAQAEELRKKTFLPYRQGLLGCLGFSSKGYGAMNGLARALNPVSSR
uniref:Uncharacterized protein n=2 Tax=Cajanus cajan TaxID=3821 RepID=A0A151U4Z6_CAJCA|nr:hypothetical protein KK1_007041 [Cajanus cajan]